MSDVTHILRRLEQGEPVAADALLPLVYQELRHLAADRLKGEAPGQTLEATALVHEAYLRLVGASEPQRWDSRGHFFAAAAEAMRRILVENARRRKRIKHGGECRRVDLNAVEGLTVEPPEDLVELDLALSRLEEIDPTKAKLVKLRYFAGLTMSEIAQAMSISLATAERYWTFARTWLFAELRASNTATPPGAPPLPDGPSGPTPV